MKRVIPSLCVAGPLVLAMSLSAPAFGDVQVGINIGIPAPPPIVVNPPPFVVVPSTPSVRYAPDLAINVFLHAGRYYAWNDGAWFVTPSLGEPWAFIEPPSVPHPVLVVPARYYRIPPGHLRKLYRSTYPAYGHHGHGEGDYGKRRRHKGDHDDDDDGDYDDDD